MIRCAPIFLASLVLVVAVTVTSAQTDDMTAAATAFQTGDYGKSIPLLKKVTSKDSSNGHAWLLLGSAYYHLEKFKDSIKAFERAVALAPKDETAHMNLAMALLAQNDKRAAGVAREVLEMDPKNAQADFVLSAYEYRNREYGKADDYAQKAVQLDKNFANAYRVIYLAALGSLVARKDKVVPPATRRETMRKATAAFQKYYDLLPGEERKDLKQQLSDMQFFGEYYNRPETDVPGDADNPPPPEPGTTPLKILSKPKASFTEKAREQNINGSVLVLVGFGSDGKVGPVMILRSLERGLDKNCITAARSIKFIPEAKNGVPVSTVKMVEYSFTLY